VIIVECYTDEFLVKSMGFPRGQIKHEGGKGKVMEIVKKKGRTVGIIDEDPYSDQPSDLENYIEKETKSTVKLLIRKDDDSKRLTQISPYLEHWLLDRARQNRIAPKDFGLPGDPKELHSIPHVERNRNFHSFLNELIEADDEINTLKKWIVEVI
jgi:hypothetical protein